MTRPPWYKQWFGAIRQEAITWGNVEWNITYRNEQSTWKTLYEEKVETMSMPYDGKDHLVSKDHLRGKVIDKNGQYATKT